MKIWTLGVIGLALGAATTANAVVMSGTFAGTITSGYASGSFGYDVDYTHAIDMTGKAISGTFTIDLDIVHGPCAGSGIFNGAYYNACYIADRGVRITQTIDGHQEVFDLTKSATPGPDWLYNMSEAGAFVDNLQSDQIIISTHAQIGDGYPVAGGRYPSVERKAGIAALLPTGTITDPGDLAGVEYAGSALTTSVVTASVTSHCGATRPGSSHETLPMESPRTRISPIRSTPSRSLSCRSLQPGR